MKRIVILISGRGSNMEALVQACRQEGWPAEIVAVISNRPEAKGLAFARSQGIEAVGLDHKAFASRESFDAHLAQVIDGFQPDLLVLAGYMRILTPAFVQRYEGLLLNIHPSLLPAFPGLHTHERALESGCRVAGATVHFVTAELDHGPIVIQSVVDIRPDDDADRLAQRVLRTEHQIYPRAVRWFVEGQLHVQGHRVVQLGGEPQVLINPIPAND